MSTLFSTLTLQVRGMCGGGGDKRAAVRFFRRRQRRRRRGGIDDLDYVRFAPRSAALSPWTRLLFSLYVPCTTAVFVTAMNRRSRHTYNPPLRSRVLYAQARLSKFRHIGQALHGGIARMAWAKWGHATRRLRRVHRTQDLVWRAFRSKVQSLGTTQPPCPKERDQSDLHRLGRVPARVRAPQDCRPHYDYE